MTLKDLIYILESTADDLIAESPEDCELTLDDIDIKGIELKDIKAYWEDNQPIIQILNKNK